MKPRQAFALALGLSIGGSGMKAGPPFLTDDPEPVELNHWEFYTFGQGERTSAGNYDNAPAFEFNYGIAPETQFHIVAPLAHFTMPGMGWASGYGDTEVGIKYRFLEENDSRPEVGIFPMAEFDTGNAARGLGNGKTWYRLPVWLQKSWGPWTTYGGVGLQLNDAPGYRNQGFAGWLLQRDLGKKWTLGGELFLLPNDPSFGPAAAIANFGGYYKFTEKFNLLFTAGHAVSGAHYTVWYLGLYWTGGPEKPEAEKPK